MTETAPASPVVTRFAPSPTGYLHIGGARTALFSALYAKGRGGKFLLRIEDTDRERSTQEAVDAIFEGMHWLGLNGDEEAVYQTERFPRYRDVIAEMLAAGTAYHCYASREELDALREQQMAAKQKPMYDGRWRPEEGKTLPPPPAGVAPVVRFKNPREGSVVVEDLVKGRIEFANTELDDLIIARADGTPTYNFCVVVDDADMGITHVIRGDDHVNNTPRQINILQALGRTPPAYAHVSMILGGDGAKLSKRHGALSVTEYRAMGFLPEALLNYLVRLSWSHGDQEIFSRDEMERFFDFDHVSPAAARFDMEKAYWVNHQFLKTADIERQVLPEFRWHLERAGVAYQDGPDLAAIVEAQRERCRTLLEMTEKSRFFFEDPVEYNAKDAAKHLTAAARPLLEALVERLSALEAGAWTASGINAAVHALATERGVGLGAVAQPVRVAVAGMAVTPPIDQTLALLDRETVLRRLGVALGRLPAAA